jgi:hypothetical protein
MLSGMEEGPKLKNSPFFSLLAGIYDAETRSNATACATEPYLNSKHFTPNCQTGTAMSVFTVAIGGKADIHFCTANFGL